MKFSDSIKLLIIILGLFVAWKLKFLLLIVLTSFILTVILLPFVRKLKRFKLPAIFAIIIPFLVLVGMISAFGIFVVPSFVSQFPGFLEDLEKILISLPFLNQSLVNVSALSDFVLDQFDDYMDLAINVGSVLAQLIFGILTITVLVAYWLNGYDSIKATAITYVPAAHRRQAADIFTRIEFKLGRWFVAQLLVSLVVGLLTYAAALALGLPYAGVLAIVAAILEIIPTFGPIAAAVPAIALGLLDSPQKALAVTIVYVIIQQLESHVISPILLGRTVKLHPIIIIVSFISGGILFGFAGALLAVPTALIISSLVDSIRHERMPNGAKARQ